MEMKNIYNTYNNEVMHMKIGKVLLEGNIMMAPMAGVTDLAN